VDNGSVHPIGQLRIPDLVQEELLPDCLLSKGSSARGGFGDGENDKPRNEEKERESKILRSVYDADRR